MMNKKIYCDLDGVLAGCMEHLAVITGVSQLEFTTRIGVYGQSQFDNWFWKHVADNKTFFRDLPLINKELWDGIKKYNPTILTAIPKAHRNIHEAAGHKKEWVAKHLGSEVPIITCIREHKRIFCQGPDSILLDDNERNIQEWNQAGGIGIFFSNTEKALLDLYDAGAIDEY